MFRSLPLALLGLWLAAQAPAAEPQAPRLSLVPPAPCNLYAPGVAPALRIEWTNGAPAHAQLTLRAVDAAGRELFRGRIAATEATNLWTLPPEWRGPYVKLTVESARRPRFAPPSIAFAVLPAVTPDPRFGFNCRPDLAPVVRQLGGVWVRAHIPWEQGSAEAPLGTNGIEQTIRTIRAGGCEVFGISSYSLPWASVVATNDDRPMRGHFSVPRPEPWDAYTAFAARQIHGRVPIYEVWNEPNFDWFWRSVPDTPGQRLDDYAALLRRSYAILKKEAPELKVTNGSLVTTRMCDSHDYLRGLLARGCGNAFDALNVHYYRGGTAPEGKTWSAAETNSLPYFLDGLRAIQAGHGLAKPVWMTEMGWSSTDPGWGFVNEAEQACYLVRSHVLCFAAGVESVLWFKLEGEPFGILDERAGPKPALAAYAQLVRALQGKAFVRALSVDTVHAYLFAGPEGSTVVAWARSPTRWPVPAEWRATGVQDMAGERVEIVRRGVAEVVNAPCYIAVETSSATAPRTP